MGDAAVASDNRNQQSEAIAGLAFQERMFVSAVYRELMATLRGTAFEDFFHRVMSMRFPDFVGVADVTERDEVAAEFNHYYRQVVAAWQEPDQIIVELQKYVAGNHPRPSRPCPFLVVRAGP